MNDEDESNEKDNKNRVKIKDIFKPILKYENNKFYDIIIKMNLFNELLIDGWEICYSKENYEKCKNWNLLPIGVIGESNSGKSFLLEKIFNIDFPKGFSQKTEGISIKYLLNEHYVLIDSAGIKK